MDKRKFINNECAFSDDCKKHNELRLVNVRLTFTLNADILRIREISVIRDSDSNRVYKTLLQEGNPPIRKNYLIPTPF